MCLALIAWMVWLTAALSASAATSAGCIVSGTDRRPGHLWAGGKDGRIVNVQTGLGMFYLDFVVLVVPAAIGLLGTWLYGSNRGTIFGGITMLVTVLVLLLFQVSPPETGPGATTSRLGSAYGLMRFGWSRWLPSFLVGAAVGSLISRARTRSGNG